MRSHNQTIRKCGSLAGLPWVVYNHLTDGRDASERNLRPGVIWRRTTNGWRALWTNQGEADVRSVVANAHLPPDANIFVTLQRLLILIAING